MREVLYEPKKLKAVNKKIDKILKRKTAEKSIFAKFIKKIFG